MQTTVTMCDSCGDYPAAYSTLDGRDDVCEECARNRGAEANGKACAAFEMFGFAIALARGVDVSDSQIREAFESCLTAPHSGGDYWFGGDHVLGPDRRAERVWMRTFKEMSS